MKRTSFYKLVLIALTFGFVATANGENEEAEHKARRLFRKLTNMTLTDDNPLRAKLIALIAAGDMNGAADAITDKLIGSRWFYDTVVRNLAITYNRNHSLNNDVNDLAALFICITRDDTDYKAFLLGDFRCYDKTVTGGNAYADGNNNHSSNAHFVFLDQNASLRDKLKQETSGAGDLGIFYTRQFGMDAYQGGTNRRPWKLILEYLYNVDQNIIKTATIPNGYIRRDPPRFSSDGSTTVFRTVCTACHAQMDPISNYFGVVDFTNNITVRRSTFAEKIGEINFTDGFQPNTTEGPLFFTDAQNLIFGFNPVPATGEEPGISFEDLGNGLHKVDLPNLKSFARVLAYSSGYARGLATRVVSLMYLNRAWTLPGITPADAEKLKGESAVIERLAQSLMTHKSIRKLFHEAAIEYLEY